MKCYDSDAIDKYVNEFMKVNPDVMLECVRLIKPKKTSASPSAKHSMEKSLYKET